jgi:hypothetical protein
MELSAEQVDAGEVDKLVQEVVQSANEVMCKIPPCVSVRPHEACIKVLRALLEAAATYMCAHQLACLLLMFDLPDEIMWWLTIETWLAQQGLDDPFKGKSAAARVARDGYLHMWDVLIREAAAMEVLFDSYLLEKVANLVIALNWCAFSYLSTCSGS